jgi:hypothetical protein
VLEIARQFLLVQRLPLLDGHFANELSQLSPVEEVVAVCVDFSEDAMEGSFLLGVLNFRAIFLMLFFMGLLVVIGLYWLYLRLLRRLTPLRFRPTASHCVYIF